MAIKSSSILIRLLSLLSFSPRHRNTGLVSSGVSLTSWGEGASLDLVGYPSTDDITIKIPYGVDVLLGWLKLNLNLLLDQLRPA